MMIPTADTQPRQFGWHAIQLNFIGSLRSSRAELVCVELPAHVTVPETAKQRATALVSTQLRNESDLTSLNLVPSPKPLVMRAVAIGPMAMRHESVIGASWER
ncbi:hypothetical protein [Bradyrhizobium embrapense]|uniref:hypothetical protein n=1 Tax=Bradyrhizobium embrapense TaxID=630921 RepID=UPI001FCD26E2|nr:hypothetical protein [Bradyrhizobium embrapense]